MFPMIFPLDETISIKLNSNKLSNKTNPVRFIQRHFNKIWTKQDLKKLSSFTYQSQYTRIASRPYV